MPCRASVQQKQKARRCEIRISGLGFPISAFRPLSEVLRRHAHRMVMMMVTVVDRQNHYALYYDGRHLYVKLVRTDDNGLI
jgi:hypothetical protein